MSMLMKKCDELQMEVYRLQRELLMSEDKALFWIGIIAIGAALFGVVMFAVGYHAARSTFGGPG